MKANLLQRASVSVGLGLVSAVLFGLFGSGGAQALTFNDCSKCHPSTNNVERHHNLTLPPRQLSCYGDPSAQPVTGCHQQVLDPVTNTYVFAPFRDCLNCHKTTVHYDRHGSYLANWMMLTGVEPGTAPLWTQITTFSVVTPAAKQYQACYRCHSYNAFGAAPTGVSTIISMSGVPLTDQPMEFNPNNLSAHPVQVPLNNQTGSYAPKKLTIQQMTAQWSNVGSQTMTCGACHAAPTTPGVTPTKYLLNGPRVYWPYDRNGKLWSLGDLRSSTSNWSADLFCVNCHPIYSGGNWKNNVHREGDHLESYTVDGKRYSGVPCVSCHSVVPHGNKRSRLIVYGYGATTPDPYPYIINTNTALLKGFRKASTPFSYGEGNCWSSSGQCDEHSSRSMTYDW